MPPPEVKLNDIVDNYSDEEGKEYGAHVKADKSTEHSVGQLRPGLRRIERYGRNNTSWIARLEPSWPGCRCS